MLTKILVYAQKQVQQYGASYVLVGIFCIINLLVPQLIWMHTIKGHPYCLFIIHTIGAILCVLLIVRDKWGKYFKHKYLPILFHLTLLYCLPFTSTLMFMASQCDSSCLINLCLSLAFLMVLVDWKTMMLLSMLGISLALSTYPHFAPLKVGLYTTSSALLIGYQAIMAVLVGILFARRKQQCIEQLEHQNKQLSYTYTSWESDRLYRLQYQVIQQQNLQTDKEPFRITKKALNALAQNNPSEALLAKKALEQLEAFFSYYKASFYQTMDAIRLNVNPISLQNLLTRINANINDATTQRVRIHLRTQQKSIICDVDKIVALLVQQIQALLWETTDIVTLSIQDTQLFYHLQAVPGSTRKLPALGFLLTQAADVDSIQPYYQGTTLPRSIEVPKTAMELPERNQAQLIEAHYGYQERTSLTPGSRLYVLPVEVNKIRAAVVDQDPIPKEVPLDNPASSALERIFMQRLLETDCLLDFTIAREAIDMIKQVHKGQFRKSGELFYTHPLTVATILLTMTQDPDTVLAALLHDVVEDTPVHLEQIAYQYGQRVAWLVQKVTNVDPTGKKTKLTEGETHEQLAASSDAYAVMIKLADRLHNIRTLAAHLPAKQRHIAQETLDFYIPLGHSIQGSGVKQVVDELATRCHALLEA
ncbi:MAG: HD domain-containing protein [Amoebophilaceae bacterium]|nr:HD domain-containing protein [Amoebophilaceae bacterium]